MTEHQLSHILAEADLGHINANDVGDLIAEVRRLQALVPCWVPVVERLPEKAGCYAVMHRGGAYGVMWFDRIWERPNLRGMALPEFWATLPESPTDPQP